MRCAETGGARRPSCPPMRPGTRNQRPAGDSVAHFALEWLVPFSLAEAAGDWERPASGIHGRRRHPKFLESAARGCLTDAARPNINAPKLHLGRDLPQRWKPLAMRRRVRFFLTSSLLLLYAGTMLLGQSLHQLAGCEHHDGAFRQPAHDAHSAGQGVSAGDDDHHDAASCPICQFHTQAQFKAPAAEVCWQTFACRDLLQEPTASVTALVPGSYSSRAPPQA